MYVGESSEEITGYLSPRIIALPYATNNMSDDTQTISISPQFSSFSSSTRCNYTKGWQGASKSVKHNQLSTAEYLTSSLLICPTTLHDHVTYLRTTSQYASDALHGIIQHLSVVGREFSQEISKLACLLKKQY